MLTHINLVRNVGRFDSVSAGANLPFQKFTVLYGENGRGKTTLSAILKSLATNDPLLIEQRHRLGAQHPPHVVVARSANQHVFQNGGWSASDDRIVVFDDDFVAQNVCSGIEIASEHCKNLHELIIGARGVALNETLQQHIREIEEHNAEIRKLGGNIPASVRGAMNVDQFCALEKRDDIDAAIAETERKINAAKASDEVQKRESFKNFALPEFDIDGLNGLLSRGLPELEAEAAQRVRDHLSHAGRNAETWVAEGLPRVAAMAEATDRNDCPFCAQSLDASPVIRHYQAYFSDAYAKLREDVTEAGKALTRDFGGDIAAAYERAIAAISESRNFWGRFADIPEQEFDTAATVRALNAAREAVRQQLLAKHAAPFEIAPLSEETLNAIGAYDALRQQHIEAMRVYEEANAKIALIKEQAASSNLSALQTDLDNLKRIKVRHSDPYDEICRKYLEAAAKKQKTERARDAAREALNQYQQQVFPRYEAAINTYLGKFHAGYRLGSVSSRNTRSGATCDYKVLINNVPVSLSANAGPSFRNTLSAGDRNTLALAFFFASLEQDSDLASKIVVIDDPMTSLDEHRSLTTRQEIIALTGRVTQVIVMSHEKPFLCGLWEAASRINRAAIMVMRNGDGSTLAEWNVNDDCITEHDRRHRLVAEFLNSYSATQERNVAVALRHILEAFVRVAYPEHFPPGSMLGPFVDKSRQRIGEQNEILSKADTVELRAILDYANKFHHDTNPAYETEQINDTELESFARRTLAFTKRT
ncbi:MULTISPECIES: AAA family ATPase [Paracoccus]|jgi:wobble nucleotide-excising tRNase|uniref:Protein CR006 P-loop domain-containing protein n=1 Tax=Paracoccus denitrificans (strain Pd 1222) TaxID=318586 RepID=A1B7A7_PARDP|nr:AAA family ATPase [Paracoccus denitrificans]ABL71401.1 conserved hypothetical protein [Paracoccus denitrificans PD1222]MBB4629496.1 wobble nucleotide-excising tRNase [Paracoccus denitrificans]MCU7430968.1 AAA family ATPase [Paracoccus denitrificans]QAR28020.1 hypothetical protein EO213_16910 [Paracoccus denitrificans]UPV97743.1 AAA family ATPase [Paracoccus denitrificans]